MRRCFAALCISTAPLALACSHDASDADDLSYDTADSAAFDGRAGVNGGEGGLDYADGDAFGDGSPEGAASGDAGPLPYPTRTAYRIKSIAPDFWPEKNEVAGNDAGGVALGLTWFTWEPQKKAPPCAATEEEYDGHCFLVDAKMDAEIAAYSSRGLTVTSIVYGVPAWARKTRPCSPAAAAGHEIFCAPDDANDYARFAGYLAQRYDGRHGKGRIADFVIHNEVNSNDWFDVGCGQGTACDATTWTDVYSSNFVAAYDRITFAQPAAKVLISLQHSFLGPSLDAPAAQHPLLSGTTFLTAFAARVAPRAWHVAYHPYAPDLRSPVFSPDDSPLVTYGNIGTLVGWLRNTFRNIPSAWDVELTESGINSLAPSSPAAQASAVCDTFRNVLGTPGVSNYVYHRMMDHPDETAAGLGLGLRDSTGAAKPAWSVWALANRDDLSPKQLSCGFEDLPYTRLIRSYSPSRGHWASSRVAPPGFTLEASWKLWRDEEPGTALLYECKVGKNDLLSRDVGCEGLEPLGPVGWAYTSPTPNTVALYRCIVASVGDHFVSPDAACEGQTVEGLLGYVLP